MIEDEEKFFDHLLYKKQCAQVTGVKGYIKNLNVLLKGRDIKDIVIIDNRSDNYSQHILNGIPIIDFHGEHQDIALPFLRDYLI